ncbi:N-acetyltransferase [Arenibacter sp. N53]|uniref:GNAT family N-acetyltransferase n=1 Tax=Arenibacter TaxID=178469 RepID=UPI000CD3AE94|nr:MULTISPECIES: GNAT family protein [Arenibacter]MCM4154288.1 N-acetyltransferase [Arenibacter sp. N53]
MKNVCRVFINLIKDRDYRSFWNILTYRFNSKIIAFGFRQELGINLIKRQALTPITIRKFKKGDEVFFIDSNTTILLDQLETCYVAINKEENPCFKCWLINSSENLKLKKFWGESFPLLKSEETLLESAFTLPKFRGLGIMPAAITLILELTREQGYKEVITFVPTENINSIRTITYAGFYPYIIRIEKWFFFRKTATFVPITEDLLEYFNKITKGIPKQTLKA